MIAHPSRERCQRFRLEGFPIAANELNREPDWRHSARHDRDATVERVERRVVGRPKGSPQPVGPVEPRLVSDKTRDASKE